MVAKLWGLAGLLAVEMLVLGWLVGEHAWVWLIGWR